MKALASSLVLCAVLSASGAAQAALVDRGGGLIYDDVLNVTWLQDANYAKTSRYNADGLMYQGQATIWASNLSYYDSVRKVTYTDWRLPTTGPVNGTAFNYNVSYNGSTDYGYNISEQGTAYAGSTGSEMAYLFYNSLNNKGYCPAPPNCSPVAQADWGLVNNGPFINLQTDTYWSGTTFAPNTYYSWFFFFYNGYQNTAYNFQRRYALAVRDGDVATVPVPAAAWLLGSGLLGLIGVARRKTA